MRYLVVFLFQIFFSAAMKAQATYDITSNGQGKNGAYYVRVTTTVKDVKTAKDELRRDAVHGVLFKGFSSNSDGGLGQKALIADPNVEQTKSEFFNAFFNERSYERYVSITESSFTSTKIKKGFEVSALLLVDKESLQKYLEDSGIIKGFSNLW